MVERKVVVERDDGFDELVYVRVARKRKPVPYPNEVMYERPIGPFL